ncbi:hypothetical protein N0V90_004270 [Kalmusia sp. IMI 367209]|nr:hypothetical protein N0V90_004270 [Kalmusia sp. IMI 367209]
MSPAAITTGAPPPTNGGTLAAKSSAKPIMTPSSVLTSAPSHVVPAWVKPDLTRLLRVEHLEGDFAARSVSLVDLPAGATFARITNPTPAACAYTSVQASRDLHIELNCDLVRVNPDLTEGLKTGDELTFFYPSTEYDMAQPFKCRCQEASCRGTIAGAKDMSLDVLHQYWLNPHIEELLREREA